MQQLISEETIRALCREHMINYLDGVEFARAIEMLILKQVLEKKDAPVYELV